MLIFITVPPIPSLIFARARVWSENNLSHCTPCHDRNRNECGWLVDDRIATVDFSHPTPYGILFVSWSSSKKSFQTA